MPAFDIVIRKQVFLDADTIAIEDHTYTVYANDMEEAKRNAEELVDLGKPPTKEEAVAVRKLNGGKCCGSC